MLDPFETEEFPPMRCPAARWHMDGMVVMVVEGRRRWHWNHVRVMQGMNVVHVHHMYLVTVGQRSLLGSRLMLGFTHVEFWSSTIAGKSRR